MTENKKNSHIGGGGAATATGMNFQAKLGSVISAWILSEQCFDSKFNLGEAIPILIRFETEAPIDDILVKTNAGGFVAIQAKTTATLSEDTKSPFGKTILQFVKHWLACCDGDGSFDWKRPLNPDKDRLVLAISSKASKTLRVDLLSALRLKTQPGGGQLTDAQQKAFYIYSKCVENAWSEVTTNLFDENFPSVLAQFITILVISLEEAGQYAIFHNILDGSSPKTALAVLEVVVNEMMEQRGGADQPTLRKSLISRGVALIAPPNYANDIEKLRGYSADTNDRLVSYESIEGADEEKSVSITRECQQEIEVAADKGSLLIIGEPGSGKSAVLNSLARTLRDDGNDVLELAVDRLSVDTIEGLNQALGLKNPLLDVINAWDGAKPAWLVIDALDATRGGKGEGVFHKLIEQVLEKDSRWKVVASIRTFDLRVGQRFRTLFEGVPPVESLQEQEFSNVRHVKISEWTDVEFNEVLDRIPALKNAIHDAPEDLLNLARVPFNTRLISDLVRRGLVADNFSNVSSQSQLLELYWDERVGREHQTHSCILQIVNAMISARTLRVFLSDIKSADITDLANKGVIITDESSRYIQFRHHLLFDYAVARVRIDSEGLIKGSFQFSKTKAEGLMLAPALSFVLRKIWENNTDRSDFWKATTIILADEETDPVIRSTTGRICAEYPKCTEDTTILADRVVASDENAAQAFMHTCGAFAIRFEDDPNTPTTPWTGLLKRVSENLLQIAGAVRFLLFKLVDIKLNYEERSHLGLAARALLRHVLSSEKLQSMVPAAIHLVAVTLATDTKESRKLLEQLFERQRLKEYGWENIPALCHQIEDIAVYDPIFTKKIYKETFGFSETEKTKTRVGNSQILGMTSNAQQDYNMARYALTEYVSKFLVKHQKEAIEAIIVACDDFVARKYKTLSEHPQLTLNIDGQEIRFQEDGSSIWGYYREKPHGHDADTLLYELFKFLRSSEKTVANNIIEELINEVNLAVFWSHMFMVAVKRNDSLIDKLLPISLNKQFLVCPDTRKDAIDLVAKGYDRLTLDHRIAFENSVKNFDFSGFRDPDDERKYFMRRLFYKIGNNNLATEFAKEIVVEINKNLEHSQNDRPLTGSDDSWKSEPYQWMSSFDPNSLVDQELRQAIESTKETLGIDNDANDAPKLTIQDALAALLALANKIDNPEYNSELVAYAEGVIGQGLSRMISFKLVPDKDDLTATDQFLDLISIICASDSPTMDPETDVEFERIPSWVSPSARVEAGAVVLNLVLQRPDIYSRLVTTIDTLIADPHPGVRLESGRHLVQISGIDSDGFWKRLGDLIHSEKNLSVLKSLINDVFSRFLHSDPTRAETLSTDLLVIFKISEPPSRQAEIRSVLANMFAILWIDYEKTDAHAIINDWIRNSEAHHHELILILQEMRGAFFLGFKDDSKEGHDRIRRRAIDLTSQIVSNASEKCSEYFKYENPTPEQLESVNKAAKLLDAACMNIYYAFDDNETQLQSHMKTFFEEVKLILKQIGDYGTPHTIHYLLQLVESLISIDPKSSFDIMVYALKCGGRQGGYQYESMGADLMIKLFGIFLADHKELFENENRRVALIECLDIFMDAGWPSARRLLYQLPELVQ